MTQQGWEIEFEEQESIYKWTEEHKHQELTIKLYCFRPHNKWMNQNLDYRIFCWGGKVYELNGYEPLNDYRFERKKRLDGSYEIGTNDLGLALELIEDIKNHVLKTG